MARSYYLDHNATTPLHPRVREAMVEILAEELGNPSSPHAPGRTARRVIEEAREAVADFLEVDAGEIFFTSGGTEANNLWVHGGDEPDAPLYVSAVEHPSILQPARAEWGALRPSPARGGVIPVDATGALRGPEALPDLPARLPEGARVSLQWVNNETGRVQDLAPHVATWRARGASTVHTDGAQGFFRLSTRLADLGVDAATLTAHKSFGPTGVGVLFLRRGTVLDPIQQGGSQERSLRPGTENVAAIHGLGVLARLAQHEELWPLDQLADARDSFREALSAVDPLRFLVAADDAFPSVVTVSLPDLPSEAVLAALDRVHVAASNGSACASGSRRPSEGLRALGLEDPWLGGVIRFSFGPSHTSADLTEVARRFRAVVAELRRSQSRQE